MTLCEQFLKAKVYYTYLIKGFLNNIASANKSHGFVFKSTSKIEVNSKKS
jgi:hypothetical protein